MDKRDLPELLKDPVKGFGINRYSQEERGTLAASSGDEEETEAGTGADDVDADLLAEDKPESEETTLNTSGVQEGLGERVKDATEEHRKRSA
jgi:hypothetical protein